MQYFSKEMAGIFSDHNIQIAVGPNPDLCKTEIAEAWI